MPRAISAELKAHLAQDSTTIAQCCKVIRQPDTPSELVFGFTTLNEDIVFEGVTYKASTGISASEFASRAALNVDSMEIIGALDSVAITEADVLAGLWDKANVEFFIVNYKDLSMGRLIISGGTTGQITSHDTQFVAELFGIMQNLQQSFGRAYLSSCDADYGDARCGHNPASLTNGQVSSTVTDVTSQRLFDDSTLAAATLWYDGGTVEWTSGLNSGVTSEVKAFTSGGTVELQLPTPFAIVVGDGFTITVGCDKTAPTCRDKFTNKINFRGFDKIPGRNRLLSGDA